MAKVMNFSFCYPYVLFSHAIAIKAQTIVELGTGTGVSTQAFIEAAAILGGKVFSIDIARCEETRQRLQNENVTFVTGDSIEMGQQWKGDIDLLFCDSDHSLERVYGELTTWERFNPKMIFVHDTLFADGTLAPPFYAIEKYVAERNKRFINFQLPHGLGMIF